MVDLSKDRYIQGAAVRMRDIERERRIAMQNIDDAIDAGNEALQAELTGHLANITAEKRNLQILSNEYGSEIVRQERANQPRSMEKLDKLELHEMTPEERFQYFNKTAPKGIDANAYMEGEQHVQSPEYRSNSAEAQTGGRKR